MFNLPSDPWYRYMQPFRTAFLKKMIKAQQPVEKTHQEQEKKEETVNP
jgi:hypothetical protein